MIASFLLLLLTIGCELPAGSKDSTGSGVESGPVVVGDSVESRRGGPHGEPDGQVVRSAFGDEGESPGDSRPPGTNSPGSVADQAFGDSRELDDPFTIIGPAFSGLGLQPYGSDCDPFEDKYGTCL